MADVLRVSQFAKLEIRRNNIHYHYQGFASEEVAYTVHGGDRVVLTTSMASPEQANLGDIDAGTPGKKLIVETDRPILVGVNSNTALWPVEHVLMMASEGITELWFQNTDADNEATVEFIVTD